MHHIQSFSLFVHQDRSPDRVCSSAAHVGEKPPKTKRTPEFVWFTSWSRIAFQLEFTRFCSNTLRLQTFSRCAGGSWWWVSVSFVSRCRSRWLICTLKSWTFFQITIPTTTLRITCRGSVLTTHTPLQGKGSRINQSINRVERLSVCVLKWACPKRWCSGGGCGWPERRKDQRVGDDRSGSDLPSRLRRDDDQVSCQGERRRPRACPSPGVCGGVRRRGGVEQWCSHWGRSSFLICFTGGWWIACLDVSFEVFFFLGQMLIVCFDVWTFSDSLKIN